MVANARMDAAVFLVTVPDAGWILHGLAVWMHHSARRRFPAATLALRGYGTSYEYGMIDINIFFFNIAVKTEPETFCENNEYSYGGEEEGENGMDGKRGAKRNLIKTRTKDALVLMCEHFLNSRDVPAAPSPFRDVPPDDGETRCRANARSRPGIHEIP